MWSFCALPPRMQVFDFPAQIELCGAYMHTACVCGAESSGRLTQEEEERDEEGDDRQGEAACTQTATTSQQM
jgi:hypothetical protein